MSLYIVFIRLINSSLCAWFFQLRENKSLWGEKMKKVSKKTMSIILVLALFVSAIPVSVSAYSAKDYTSNTIISSRLNSLFEEFTPNLSYFKSTPNGGNKNGDKSKPCSRIKNSNGQVVGGYDTCGSFDGKIQCRAYALYTQYTLFGKTENGKINPAISAANSIKYVTVKNPSKADIMNMPLGAHIRNDGDNRHSTVLLRSDSNTITYIDCNCSTTWGCAVHLHTVPWSQFFSTFGIGVSKITNGYAKYPSADTYPKEQNPPYGKTPFIDISEHWAKDMIESAYLMGMINGVSENRFAPQDSITRAMFVQILYNMAENSNVQSCTYTDVPSDAWYAKAVGWAEQNNIVNGTGNGLFSPNDFLTREQAAQILYNMTFPDSNYEADTNILNQFNDSYIISSWATRAVSWAVESQLLQGNGNSILAPISNMTRAETVTVLLKFKDYSPPNIDAHELEPKIEYEPESELESELELVPDSDIEIEAETSVSEEILTSNFK